MMTEPSFKQRFPSSIQDNLGRSYCLQAEEDTTGFKLKLSYQGKPAGHIYLGNAGSVLQIADLLIEDCVIGARSGLFSRILVSVGLLSETIPLRGHGLGTKLLSMVVKYATGKGYQSIEGWLSAVDLKQAPQLRNFYLRAGFDITGTTPRPSIRLALPNTS